MQILLVTIFIAFFLSPYQLFSIGKFGVTLTEISALVLYIYVIKKIIWDGIELKIVKHPAHIFLLMFLGAVFLAGLNPLFDSEGSTILQYLKSALHLLFVMSFAFICIAYPITKEMWSAIVKTWLICSIFLNVFAIYQIFARAFDLPFAWLEYTNISLTGRDSYESVEDVAQLSLKFANFYRATSIFSEPSTLAIFNLYIISFIVIPYIQKTGQFLKSKGLNIFIFVLSVVTLFLTFSLSGTLGIFIIIFSILFLERRKKFVLVLSTFLGAVILLFVADVAVKSYANISVLELFSKRIGGIISYTTGRSKLVEGESFDGRIANAEQIIEIWENYPITGIGLGLTYRNKGTDIEHSDITLLAILAEMGIVGFLVFIALFTSLVASAVIWLLKPYMLRNLPPGLQRLAGLAFYIMLVQFVINFLVGNQLISVGSWFPMGIVFGIIRLAGIESGGRTYSFKFTSIPLKEMFRRNIKKSVQVKS